MPNTCTAACMCIDCPKHKPTAPAGSTSKLACVKTAAELPTPALPVSADAAYWLLHASDCETRVATCNDGCKTYTLLGLRFTESSKVADGGIAQLQADCYASCEHLHDCEVASPGSASSFFVDNQLNVTVPLDESPAAGDGGDGPDA